MLAPHASRYPSQQGTWAKGTRGWARLRSRSRVLQPPGSRVGRRPRGSRCLGSVDWSSKLQVEFRGLLTLLQQGVFLG